MTTDERRTEKLGEAAEMGADAVIAFFKYQGDNPKYLKSAKVGIAAGSNWVKKLSSDNNREQIRLDAEKMDSKKK